MAFLNATIFVVFFATGSPMLLVGQILCGLSWGVFATLSPAYGELKSFACDGNTPNLTTVCSLRGLSRQLARLHDDVRQSLLGRRPTFRGGRSAWLSVDRGRDVVQDPVCYSMGNWASPLTFPGPAPNLLDRISCGLLP